MADPSQIAANLISNLKEFCRGQNEKIDADKMRNAIRKAPAEAFSVKLDEHGNTLLHETICILRNMEKNDFMLTWQDDLDIKSVLDEMILKAPNSLSSKNARGQVALHLACDEKAFKNCYPRAQGRTISLLVKASPMSTIEPDKDGRVPLHYLAHRTLDFWDNDDFPIATAGVSTVFGDLITEDAAKATDSDGRVALHYIVARTRRCTRNSQQLFSQVLEAYPEACTMTSNSGDLPIHYGAKNGELSRFRELVKRYPESLSVRNGAGKLPLETALDASSFSIAAYLVINHGATVPPGLNFSNLLANSMRLKERVELPKLISLTPSEQFPRALDVYLTEARLPAYRKEMVFLALSEFMKKLGEQASTPATTTLDDESKQVIAAAKAEVEELKQTCSDLQNRNKEREAQLEKQITELSQKASEDAQSQSEQLEVEHEQQLEQLEKQIEEAQKAFSDLQEKASRQEELLALEKAKVSSVEMKQAQTEPLFQAYAEARRCEEKFLSGNHLPNTSALTSIAQSLNDRLTKLGTQRSVSQRFLSLILAQDQPDEEDLIQVVKSLSSELADIENDLLLTNNDSAHVPATNVTDEVDTPSEPAKKRARVSLSPSSHH